jgi:two-component system, NtrC family, response regulator AtoC
MASILVVDDEEGIREFVQEVLASDHHEVTAASNGVEALHELQTRAFDIMITDLKMPGPLDGIDLLRRSKADAPEMEVILLTAHGTVDTAVEAMKGGAFDYLQKPIASPSELRLLISRALERRALVARDEVRRQARTAPPLTYGDPVMQPVMKAIERVAPTSSTVLLLGATGTGKELVAQAIHDESPRAAGPFVPVNCAAISETLMESEIFGHEKGAFTGATNARRGRLELAEGGTLFLDEVGELKLELQAKLLRVLQERRFERLGGSRTIQVDVRWIAATNRDLDALVASGQFREDLYHRLAVFPIALPPLRERHGDIVPIAENLLGRISAALGHPPLHLDAAAKARILEGTWPGNVRELANALERAAILADGNELRADDLHITRTRPAGQGGTIEEIEVEAIRRTLDEVGGNRRRAAERLGMGERTLYDKLKRYGLT